MEPPAAPATASRKRPQPQGPASSEILGQLSATELLAGAAGEALAKEILAAYHSSQHAMGVDSAIIELGVLDILMLSDAGRELLALLSTDLRALAKEHSWPAKAFEQCGCAQQCLRVAAATAEGMTTLDAAALRLVLAQDRAAATPATKRGKKSVFFNDFNGVSSSFLDSVVQLQQEREATRNHDPSARFARAHAPRHRTRPEWRPRRALGWLRCHAASCPSANLSSLRGPSATEGAANQSGKFLTYFLEQLGDGGGFYGVCGAGSRATTTSGGRRAGPTAVSQRRLSSRERRVLQ